MYQFARFILVALAGLVSVSGSAAQTAQDSLRQRSMMDLTHGLDTALSLLGMRRADLTMPADLLDRDRHRSPFHDRLFTDPISVFAWTDSLSAELSSALEQKSLDAIDGLMQGVSLARLRRTFHANVLTLDDLRQRSTVNGIDSLSTPLRMLIVRYLGALILTHEAVESALNRQRNLRELQSELDSLWRLSPGEEDLTLWQIYEQEGTGLATVQRVSQTIDTAVVSTICSQGASLYADLLHLMAETTKALDVLSESVGTITVSTRYGRVAIGGTGPDTYSGEYACIVDLGGNDTYNLSGLDRSVHTRCIVDFSGNDVYRGADHTLGSGSFGVGILIDWAGDDEYHAADYSLGSGLYGVGILHDVSGNDIYRGRTNCQGSGITGIGMLIDQGGHDLYVCAAQAQAFGATNGAGALVDVAGNDRYIAVSPFADVLRYDDHQVSFVQGAALGSRPAMSGGIGLLVDAAGNDLYSCDIYGQGTGYWFGLGALVDLGGDDRYDAYQYAQGSGVHFAVGIMHDAKGNDTYRSHGVSQGCGHDIATGILLDDHGDDVYVCESLSLGSGNANAVSILVDARGNDAYSASNVTNTLGYSDMRRGYGMIGLFVDAEGSDRYGETSRNDTVTMKSSYGVFADLGPQATASAQTASEQSKPVTLTSSVDSLFVQASASHLRFQNAVAPARAELGRRSQQALDFLSTKFGTQMPRERITLEFVLPQIYKSDPDSTTALLLRKLESASMTELTMSATVIGKVKCRQALPRLQKMLADSSWKRRRLAAVAIGEIDDSASVCALAEISSDVHPYVRQRAAYHAGRRHPDALAVLGSALADTLQIVRMAAVEGITRGQRRKASALIETIDRCPDPKIATSLLRLLAAADTTKRDIKAFTAWFKRLDEARRRDLHRLADVLPRLLADVVNGARYKKRKRTKA